MNQGQFQGGLVSVTFRALPPHAIIDLVKRAGLKGIEWGGDGHVPHGDESRAREVATLTRAAGLECCAYGSYYRLGVSAAAGLPFEQVLASARALGAPVIRVWAGDAGSAGLEPSRRAAMVADGVRVADLAARAGLGIVLEYHPRTLTDTEASVGQLMRELDHPAVRFLWQPPLGGGVEANLKGLRQVLPRLANLHVAHWVQAGPHGVQHPLEAGIDAWRQYLAVVRETPATRWVLLEFVRGADPEQFFRDAETLLKLVSAPG